MANPSISSEALSEKTSLVHLTNQTEPTDKFAWKRGMSSKEQEERLKWLTKERGRQGLRIVIITGEMLLQKIVSV
jgi:hypothetical protein